MKKYLCFLILSNLSIGFPWKSLPSKWKANHPQCKSTTTSSVYSPSSQPSSSASMFSQCIWSLKTLCLTQIQASVSVWRWDILTKNPLWTLRNWCKMPKKSEKIHWNTPRTCQAFFDTTSRSRSRLTISRSCQRVSCDPENPWITFTVFPYQTQLFYNFSIR